MIMNKLEAISYTVLAINTLQNTANGDYKFKDIKLKEIESEMKAVFRIYKRENVIEIAEKIKNYK